MRDREAVENWMNKYPVIYLTFKDIDGLEADVAMDVMRGKLASLFQGYGFISVPSDEEGEIFRKLCNGKGSVSDSAHLRRTSGACF